MTGSTLGTSRPQRVVGGEPGDAEVDRLELESARRALRLLRDRLTAAEMEKLLASDLERTDDQWRAWAAASDGSWKAAETEFQVVGLSMDQFVDWWETAQEDVHGIMFPAFPEHYRFGWTADPGGGDEQRFLIIEELGHVPFRMYCSFGPEWAPVECTPGYDTMGVGVGRLADGTEAVRFMNQVKDTPEGFTMIVGVYMVSAVPDDVVQSHVEQEIVEWTHWIEMALAQPL